MSAAVPILIATGIAEKSRRDRAKAKERAAAERREIDRRRNLLEYEQGRRERSRAYRTALSRLRASRAAAGFGGSRVLGQLERNLLDEFNEEEDFRANQLGLRNRRLGIVAPTNGGSSVARLLGQVSRL